MAYIDPSAGSMILQVALAAMVGGALTAKRWWGGLTRAVRGSLNRLRSR
jgi:hypothetical protein